MIQSDISANLYLEKRTKKKTVKEIEQKSKMMQTSFSSLRPCTTTLSPRCASSNATSRPMPYELPVTTAQEP
jgi:hypothetical protein